MTDLLYYQHLLIMTYEGKIPTSTKTEQIIAAAYLTETAEIDELIADKTPSNLQKKPPSSTKLLPKASTQMCH